MKISIIEKAKEYSYKKHREINHKYAGKYPYELHLDFAFRIGYSYKHLLEEYSPVEQDAILAAIYLHDTLEDCHVSYQDLKNEFGEFIAEIIYAVTNEKGRTRAERASNKYYRGIVDNRAAVFVKLSDRLANVLSGLMLGSTMFKKYKKENVEFLEKLEIEKSPFLKMAKDLVIVLETKIFDFSNFS